MIARACSPASHRRKARDASGSAAAVSRTACCSIVECRSAAPPSASRPRGPPPATAPPARARRRRSPRTRMPARCSRRARASATVARRPRGAGGPRSRPPRRARRPGWRWRGARTPRRAAFRLRAAGRRAGSTTRAAGARTGEPARRHRVAALDELAWPLGVGREQHVERRALFHLGRELPARAGADHQLVPGGLGEQRTQLVQHRPEVGGHGHPDRGGRGWRSRAGRRRACRCRCT